MLYYVVIAFHHYTYLCINTEPLSHYRVFEKDTNEGFLQVVNSKFVPFQM